MLTYRITHLCKKSVHETFQSLIMYVGKILSSINRLHVERMRVIFEKD